MNSPTLPEYIKPGAFVKLRDGSKGEIYSIDNAFPYPIHGRTLSDMQAAAWTENLYICASIEYSEQDIIGPWIDKPNCDKLWSILPPWIKYLAQDYNGDWYASLDKPELKENYWLACPGKFIVIPKGYAPIYSGDWKASLVERTQ